MSLLHILSCASVQSQEHLSVSHFFKVGVMVFLLPHGSCILAPVYSLFNLTTVGSNVAPYTANFMAHVCFAYYLSVLPKTNHCTSDAPINIMFLVMALMSSIFRA